MLCTYWTPPHVLRNPMDLPQSEFDIYFVLASRAVPCIPSAPHILYKQLQHTSFSQHLNAFIATASRRLSQASRRLPQASRCSLHAPSMHTFPPLLFMFMFEVGRRCLALCRHYWYLVSHIWCLVLLFQWHIYRRTMSEAARGESHTNA